MKGKIYLLAIICLLCNVRLIGQAPGWAWVKEIGGTISEGTVGIRTDDFGNVFVTGSFRSANLTFDNSVLTPVALTDIFTAKLDSGGNVIWAKGAGGNDAEGGVSLSTDHAGNVIIIGDFKSDTLYFGSNYLIKTDTTNSNNDLFVAKYDSSGTFLWAVDAGGINNASINSSEISIDQEGNIYITGFFIHQVSFDTTLLSSSTGNDLFVAKYDAGGNLLWAKSFSGSGNEYGTSIDAKTSDAVYMCGYFNGDTLTLGNIVLNNTSQYNDLFIAKLNSSGNVIWANNAAGNGADAARKVTTDDLSNVYITGIYTSDSLSFNGVVLTKTYNNSGGDIFITKYDSSGTTIWATSINGSPSLQNFSEDLAIDEFYNIYVTGFFNSNVLHIGNTISLTNTSTYDDIFWAEFDSSGTPLWAKKANGSNADLGVGITTDGNNQVYTTGNFRSAVLQLDSFSLNNASTTAGGMNFYISKLGATVTGMEELQIKNHVIISPNPTTSHFTITSPSIIDELTITDVMGRIIYSAKPINKMSQTIGMELEREGIYFVTVSAGEERMTGKVVVAK